MPTAKPLKYIVRLPDGNEHTRNSHRTYTNAIAVRIGDQWRVSSFCGSPTLAEKECATQQRLHARRSHGAYDEYRILPVEVAAPTAAPTARAMVP